MGAECRESTELKRSSGACFERGCECGVGARSPDQEVWSRGNRSTTRGGFLQHHCRYMPKGADHASLKPMHGVNDTVSSFLLASDMHAHINTTYQPLKTAHETSGLMQGVILFWSPSCLGLGNAATALCPGRASNSMHLRQQRNMANTGSHMPHLLKMYRSQHAYTLHVQVNASGNDNMQCAWCTSGV